MIASLARASASSSRTEGPPGGDAPPPSRASLSDGSGLVAFRQLPSDDSVRIGDPSRRATVWVHNLAVARAQAAHEPLPVERRDVGLVARGDDHGLISTSR